MIKIIYTEPPWSHLPQLCECCDNEIDNGDECYYAGDGVYLCSLECVNKWNGE